jgi:hypothetical protein
MKIRIQVDANNIRVDETVEGRSEEDVARQFRSRVEARAPFLVKMALRAMDDRAFWRQIVEMHNKKTGASEPVPATATEFLAFGERTGYATRLEA